MAAHTPVMVDRIVELVQPAITGGEPVIVDATLGAGGHAEALLAAYPAAYLIGIDRDPAAVRAARDRLARFSGRLELAHAVYDEVTDILDGRFASAVVFDLGVSSMQLDREDRGFAYTRDVPLDMRMNPDDRRSAADLIAAEDADALASILSEYGQERFAKRIAATIVRRREHVAITRSEQLVKAVRDSIPAAARRTGGNPAKRTFQALRIAVNDELRLLAEALPVAMESTAVNGRVAVMAYHSLEDRIVKQAFADRITAQVPRDVPVVPDALQPRFSLVTRGAERPTAEEVRINPRAQSVRLRAVERRAA